jgi:hypothetical protein
LRADTNEFVEVRSLDRVTATELRCALFEMSAMGAGSRSQRPLYHASIYTPVWEALTDEQKEVSIERLGRQLGLAEQPHVVVEHIKEGRQHLHVVWLRIDAETGKAIPDSHNYRKHEEVARELEREFGHNRVQGAHHERDGVERPARRPTLAETRQAERSGMTPEEAKAQLRELWGMADTGQAFAVALDDAGWTLARGDKRGFVALDPTGEVRAVNKDITGLSAARVRERLADLDADRLPGVDEARVQQRDRQRDLRRDQVQEAAVSGPSTEAVPAPSDEMAQQREANREPFEVRAAPESAANDAPLTAVVADAVIDHAANDEREAERERVAAILRSLDDRARDISGLVASPQSQPGTQTPPQPAAKMVAPPAGPVISVAPPQEPQQPRPFDVPRLRQVIDQARTRLEALGDRLEAAFTRVREVFDRKAQADQVAARKDELRQTLNPYRRSWEHDLEI